MGAKKASRRRFRKLRIAETARSCAERKADRVFHGSERCAVDEVDGRKKNGHGIREEVSH